MYVEPHYDGTRVSYLQQVAGGATPTKPTNRYAGYISPSVPSINDIFLELDKPFEFPGEELGGLYARDLPLNQRQKIVYPEFVLSGSYKLIYSSAYWADFGATPNSLGLYPSLSGITTPPYSTFNIPVGGGWSSAYPPFGPHPNAGVNNSSFFFGGFIMLVKN
jgi:hypothetical protein